MQVGISFSIGNIAPFHLHFYHPPRHTCRSRCSGVCFCVGIGWHHPVTVVQKLHAGHAEVDTGEGVDFLLEFFFSSSPLIPVPYTHASVLGTRMEREGGKQLVSYTGSSSGTRGVKICRWTSRVVPTTTVTRKVSPRGALSPNSLSYHISSPPGGRHKSRWLGGVGVGRGGAISFATCHLLLLPVLLQKRTL